MIGLLTTDGRAQGVVLFANSNLPRTNSTGTPLERRVFADYVTPVREGVTGTGYRAQLVYQNNAGQWVADPIPAAFFGSATLAGYWQGASRTLVNAGGASPVQMYVRVWEGGAAGLTYDQTVASGGWFGYSTIFSYTEEFNPPPNNTADKWMDNFPGFGVPEPSVFALGAVGVLVLLLRRRR